MDRSTVSIEEVISELGLYLFVFESLLFIFNSLILSCTPYIFVQTVFCFYWFLYPGSQQMKMYIDYSETCFFN